MKIYTTAAHEPLQEHLENIQNTQNPGTWRCFTTKLDKALYHDPYAQRIALNFIEEHYKDFDVYEFAFYWLKTGHVFLFFQGRMKKAHETFERFLHFISENEDSAKPVFEVYDMGKQFSRVKNILVEAMEGIKNFDKSEEKNKDWNKKKKVVVKEARKKIDRLKKERSLRVKPLLLLVEDERMTQAFVSSLLENYCEVILAGTVAEGLELYTGLWPDIVFMDIMLPDGDGQDLTEKIIKIDPDAYVIMVSGYVSNDAVLRCKKVGVKGFIAKPVTQDKERLMQHVFNYNQHKKKL